MVCKEFENFETPFWGCVSFVLWYVDTFKFQSSSCVGLVSVEHRDFEIFKAPVYLDIWTLCRGVQRLIISESSSISKFLSVGLYAVGSKEFEILKVP